MTPGHVERLLARARRRIMLELALRGAVLALWLALVPVAGWALAARLVVLPELLPACVLLLLGAPLAGALAGGLLRPTTTQVRRRAGRMTRAPALFLAQAAGAVTRLAILVGAQAEAAARQPSSAAALPQALPRGTRLLPLPLLLTALLLAAPGRREPALRLGPELTRNLVAEKRHLKSAVSAGALTPEQRRAAERVLADLESAGFSDRQARAALKVLERMAREAGGDSDLLARRLRDDAILREVARALGSADPGALQRAVDELSKRLAKGLAVERDRHESAARLLAVAAEIRDRELAERLRAFGNALGRGSGEEAGEALEQAAARLAPVPGVVRELETFVIMLEDATGTGGSAAAGVGSGRGSAERPAPRGASGGAPALAAHGVERPRHEIILRRYFDR